MSNLETQQSSIDTISRLTQIHEKLDTPQVKRLLNELRQNSESYSRDMLDRAIQSAIDMRDSKEAVAGAFLGFAEKIKNDRQKALDGALKELVEQLDFGQTTTQV